MTRRTPNQDHALDAILSKAETPNLPEGLAERIIAQVSQLPQQAAREELVAGLAEPAAATTPEVRHQPQVRHRKAWFRAAVASGAIALAASIALLLFPFSIMDGARGDGSGALTTVPSPEMAVVVAEPSTMPPSMPQEKEASVGNEPPANTRSSALAEGGSELATPLALEDERAIEIADHLATDISPKQNVESGEPSMSILVPPDEEQMAEVVSPQRQVQRAVQGPPVPPELIGRSSGSMQGLGIAGSGAASNGTPPESGPGRPSGADSSRPGPGRHPGRHSGPHPGRH